MRHDNVGHEHSKGEGSAHDAHIRHHEDHPGKSHLHNAMAHLHSQVRNVDSLAVSGHYSHEGEPRPKEKSDKPGV